MSAIPSRQEAAMLAQILKKQELETKNKQAAKEQLLRIQLLLSQRTK